MISFEWIPLGFGGLMATIDVLMLGLIRKISSDKVHLIRWMIIPTIIYAIQPWIFLSSLRFESLIVMNLIWDLISGVFVTLMGLLYFKEHLGPYKTLGVILSFISIALMSITDGTWEEFLMRK